MRLSAAGMEAEVLHSCLLLFIASLLLQVDDLLSTARELYRQAVDAFEDGRSELAYQHLNSLLKSYADSEYSQLAVVVLAEQHIINSRANEAVSLLAPWVAESSSSVPSRSSGIANAQNEIGSDKSTADVDPTAERIRKLYVTALARLSDSELESVHMRLFSKSDVESPEEIGIGGKLPVIREQARRAVQAKKHEEALDWLKEMGVRVTSHERELREYHLPLAILQGNPPQSTIQRLHQDIAQSEMLSYPQQISLKLAVAEAYRHLNQINVASQVLDQLSGDLTLASLESTQSSEQLPGQFSVGEANTKAEEQAQATGEQWNNWQAAVDLKRAELLIQNGNYPDACTLLRKAIDKYPNFSHRNEIKFLFVRSLIAEIEFDQASAVLNNILAETPADSEPQARALWILGEIELLKRETNSAIGYYEQVVLLEEHPQWRARALLQLGKCMELKSKPMEAIDYYQQVVTQHGDSDVAKPAALRLSQLQNLPSQASLDHSRNTLQRSRQTTQGQSNQLR